MILLPRLAKQVMRRSDPQALGIDLRLLMALSYLGDHDGAPQQELVDALCIDAKNVVLLLNELEDLGHLVRRRDAEDRRRHRVFMTDSGWQILAHAAHMQTEKRTRSSPLSTPTSARRSTTCYPRAARR